MGSNFPTCQQAKEKDVVENSKGRDPRGYGVTPDVEQAFGKPICYASNTISLGWEPYWEKKPVRKHRRKWVPHKIMTPFFSREACGTLRSLYAIFFWSWEVTGNLGERKRTNPVLTGRTCVQPAHMQKQGEMCWSLNFLPLASVSPVLRWRSSKF